MASEVLAGRQLRKSTLLSRIQDPKRANGQTVKEKPQQNDKGRRTLTKQRFPKKSPATGAKTYSSRAVTYKGHLYTIGDIVAIETDEGAFYGQITGFLTDPYGEKSASLAWLVPTDRSGDVFDPKTWILGVCDDTPHKLRWLRYITHLSPDYFKTGICI